MKPLVSAHVNVYLFWIRRTASLKHCIGQHGRFFSAVKAVQGTQTEVIGKAGPRSKTQKNIGKRFCTTARNPVTLMDFEVWPVPRLLYSIRGFLNYLLALNNLDSISISEFRMSSGKALHVVANLLSELRFSELDGLLTPECKQEVERNIKTWKKSYITHLAFKPEQVSSNIPCDCCILSGVGNNEKSFVEIRVIHYVWLQCSSEFLQEIRLNVDPYSTKSIMQELGTDFENLHMGAVFNSKFVKEITKGTTDQWIISAINLKLNPHMLWNKKF